MYAIDELIIIIKQLAEVMENMRNPFRDQSSDLYRFDTKDIMIRESVDTLRRIKGLGKQPYDTFVHERIIMRNKPLTDNKPLTHSKK